MVLREIHADRNVYPYPPGLTFEQIEDALLKNKAEGLLKVAAMQGNGELFGVDENGKFLFKDRGNEPVMYGFDKKKKLITVYNHDPTQMAQIAKLADYYEIYEAVYGPEDAPTGYELFPDCPDYEKTGMVAAVEEITKVPFVRSADGQNWRSSWLDNGRKHDKNAVARGVSFNPFNEAAYVDDAGPSTEYRDHGASRLLRV